MSAAQRASLLDRALRPFTDVRAGEGVTALLMAANVFLILAAYYAIKPVRDGLVLAEEGAEIRAYLNTATVLVLALVVPAYGWLADRYPRKRLINIVTWIFAGCLVAFFFAGQAGIPVGIAFFVFASMFAVMIVAQFWSFANDIYRREEGERLFPLVAFGASLGGVVGVTMIAEVIEAAGVYVPMLIGAAILLLQLQITNYVDWRERRSRESHRPDVEGEEDDEVEDYDGELSGKSAFPLVASTPYLLLICFLVLFLNWVNTNGEYILSRVITDMAGEAGPEAAQERIISAFYATFYRNVNIAGLLIQLFLVSRIIKYIGIRWAVMILPTIALGVYATIAFVPLLGVIKWAKTAENSTDYSLNNTVRHALFLPTTREQKYKGKQVSDSWFHRAGDVMSSLTVFVGTALLGLSTTAFALTNLALAAAFLLVAWRIGANYKLLVETGRPPQPRSRPIIPVPSALVDSD